MNAQTIKLLRAPDAPGPWWVWHLDPPPPNKSKWIGVYVPAFADGRGLKEWQATAAKTPTYWTPAIKPPDPTNIQWVDEAPAPRTYPPCKGTNCGSTDGWNHSPECRKELDEACGVTTPTDTPTPETDALLLAINEGRTYKTNGPEADLSRKLERERNDAQAEAREMREALEWYEEQARKCRKMTPEGDVARADIDRDGGQRARAVLDKYPPPQPSTE